MFLIGAGGHARVVLDIVSSNRVEVEALVTRDAEGIDYRGIPVIHESDWKGNTRAEVIVAIGDNRIRKKVAEKFRVFSTAVHASAIISESVSIGEGTVVMQGAVLQAETAVGRHAIINTAAAVDHDCVIGDYVHIGPGAILTGGVTVGEGALVGTRACVIPGKTIGKWAVVGAGAVVLSDIPDHAVAVGNPARIIRFNNKE